MPASRCAGFGTAEGTTVELALSTKRASSNWRLSAPSLWTARDVGAGWPGSGKSVWAPATKGRLAIRVRGPHRGARIEVDQVGLFAAPKLDPVGDNADFTWFEAETMAAGKAWKVRKHYEGWYSGLPSGMKMLAGNDAVAEKDNQPASHTVRVRQSGPHRLWVRLVRTNAANHGTYTLAVRQEGKTIASRPIDDGDARLGADFSWVWVSLDANLAAGPAEIVLRRPAAEVSCGGSQGRPLSADQPSRLCAQISGLPAARLPALHQSAARIRNPSVFGCSSIAINRPPSTSCPAC